MDYQILMATSPGTLATLVKSLLSAGWEPLGGVAAISGFSGSVLFQAMVLVTKSRRKNGLHKNT